MTTENDDALFAVGRDPDSPLKGMSEKEIKDLAKKIRMAMKNPSLVRTDTVPDKISRLSTPNLARFDAELRKTVK